VIAALWYGLGRITRPLRQLASAADGFGLDAPAPEMPRRGPREVQALSDALERMHGRLTAMVTDRTRMLAALGHDLRSPITALRVRAEMVDDDETRERMAATLDEMQEMVDSTLAYARGVSTDQPMEETDLAGLVHGLAEELSETGPEISVEAPAPVRAEIRRTAMRRALRNLMENAQRYGAGARATVRETARAAEILIEDEGPGIPEDDLEKVFDPFTRLETSRSRETGGIGLGLPIARSILRAHGGDVTLTNRTSGGLRATIHLPRTESAAS
ncbi:MAG: two-component sensor histidine kinase, partial [Marivita sp.]|uniref:ATP-binding protein n=1 Tax=Marivita sp. TaxID=2003365 RepID=UPI001B21C770